MTALRHATQSDIPGILPICNEVVRTSNAVFTEIERSCSDQLEWWRAKTEAGLPVLVAVETDEVVAFASYGPFRPWPGYRHTVEHSIYVRADRRHPGHGSKLLGEIIRHARGAGVHVMVAGIDGGNLAFVRPARAHGFQEAGRLHGVALKHQTWLDLVLLGLRLART